MAWRKVNSTVVQVRTEDQGSWNAERPDAFLNVRVNLMVDSRDGHRRRVTVTHQTLVRTFLPEEPQDTEGYLSSIQRTVKDHYYYKGTPLYSRERETSKLTSVWPPQC